METYRAFLAIIISFLILLGYQYFFVGSPSEETVVEGDTPPQATETIEPQVIQQQQVIQQVQTPPAVMETRDAKKVSVDTPLYTAVFSEAGGTVESFILKEHRETNEEGAPGKQLVRTVKEQGYPLKFAWGSVIPAELYYTVNTESVSFTNGEGELILTATSPNGLEIEKKFVFHENSYLIDLEIKIKNPTDNPLQGNPQLFQINTPFQGKTTINRFLFTGPAVFLNGVLQEYKAKEFAEGPLTVQGTVDWVAYEGTYFMCAVVPPENVQGTLVIQGSEELTATQFSGNLDTLNPGEEIAYPYHLFYGPKKLSLLQSIGYNLDKSIDFGWFDVIAKPTLWLLNFFYEYVRNYGIAIILVTIIFKAIFWPITQKGLKSMKNMQKLQPKMMKIKEKYKNDPQAMNREVMNLYKTYKVNPLGGCLPMVLQIPVFFALYKVLLLCIELRHAPFMLWISDLSAPDRLWIGFDIPWLGGIPVLTLLMGASMFIQQKLTPTTADPTQARIMMMLPIVFTFMFLNFASGLVLYWFVNNLLSILQQQLINRGGGTQKA